MNKEILTFGYIIPSFEDKCISPYGRPSLMDADILLIDPEVLQPNGDWVKFTSSDGGCYNVETSKKYLEKVSHIRKEITDHFRAGKTVFVFLSQEKVHSLATSISSPRKGEKSYSTMHHSNYSFLPSSIGTLTSAHGKNVTFTGNPIFASFYNQFKADLSFEIYLENIGEGEAIFTGRDKSKILGAVYKIEDGHLITLPVLKYLESDFTEIKIAEDGIEYEFWNEEGKIFGQNLVKYLLEIDNKLTSDSKKTPTPVWATKKQFTIKNEKLLLGRMAKNEKKIAEIKEENDEIKIQLEKEVQLKDLLFEKGKPLETAVIKALKILGYAAESYDDGDLEIDQVITSPEGIRYIGESEGKDNKDINVTKYRQLLHALAQDFARDEVEEKAFGILFGNAERFKDPEERKLDFTQKCKTDARREKIALIKTVDLFAASKYLSEKTDEAYKKACRDAIHKYLGEIVVFPTVPKKK